MTKEQFFEMIMTICDWETPDDEEKLEPLIEYLSFKSDEEIFAFDDIMAQLLYDIDTKKNFTAAQKYSEHSDDTFLYSRCVALVNGEDYYERVKRGQATELWEMEFECILYVPSNAWARKHNSSADDYPHLTAVSYETGSNVGEWG